jgi:hypothetical protein
MRAAQRAAAAAMRKEHQATDEAQSYLDLFFDTCRVNYFCLL